MEDWKNGEMGRWGDGEMGVRNMQNGWRGIPYYQQFLEFPRHFFIGFQ
jgi:hypothetical protein